jgi:hypothetical protein
MEWAGGRWVALAEVAHIHGLNKGSRRYDEKIPEPDRNSFKNLLLLCEKHHKLVDGKDTWTNYPVVTLIAWKQDREGDLAGELGQLDWITPDTLHDLMAEAIEDTQSRILEAIDGISTVSGETLAMLKALVAETLKLPYLNPDDVASLERSADVLQVVIPEYVPQLSRSADPPGGHRVRGHPVRLHQAPGEPGGLRRSAAVRDQPSSKPRSAPPAASRGSRERQQQRRFPVQGGSRQDERHSGPDQRLG